MTGFIYDPVKWCVIAPWSRDHRPSIADLASLKAVLEQAVALTKVEVVVLHPGQPPEPVPDPTEAWLREQAAERAVCSCGAQVMAGKRPPIVGEGFVIWRPQPIKSKKRDAAELRRRMRRSPRRKSMEDEEEERQAIHAWRRAGASAVMPFWDFYWHWWEEARYECIANMYEARGRWRDSRPIPRRRALVPYVG